MRKDEEEEKTPPPLPEDLRAVLRRLRNDLEVLYGARYQGLVLHGSYARGEADEGSDVDLLLLLDGPVDPVRELLRIEPLAWPPSLESGYVISVLPVDSREFRRSEKPFLWNAREDGVPAP